MCITPMTIKRKFKAQDGSLTRVVNCGKCGKCLRKKQLDWCFRLGKELENSTSACFLTLTYSDENAPYAEGGYSLLRRDFQNFMKRLRKHAQSTKIKYYACGEYGSKTERPHYHAIVFNLPRPFEKVVEKAWKLGHIHIGTVTESSIFYTTKYTLKGIKRRKSEIVDQYGREPEFQLMSNGLGLQYVKEPIVNYLRNKGSKLLRLQGGNYKKLPRYYEEKMFTDPTEKMLWRAHAQAELQQDRPDYDDNMKRSLYELDQYRLKRDNLNNGSI